jgi:hypothetical protein
VPIVARNWYKERMRANAPSKARRTAIATALALLAGSAVSASCSAPKAQDFGASLKTAGPVTTETKVLSFAVTNDYLNVDNVVMLEGAIQPDGNRDHAFTATIDGPFEALFLVECDAKGQPVYGYRADTISGPAELPQELGGVIDQGQMTVGVGVVEKGRYVNQENGAVQLLEGVHSLTLYAPNTAALQAGDFVCLYARGPNGGLAKSRPAPY